MLHLLFLSGCVNSSPREYSLAVSSLEDAELGAAHQEPSRTVSALLPACRQGGYLGQHSSGFHLDLGFLGGNSLLALFLRLSEDREGRAMRCKPELHAHPTSCFSYLCTFQIWSYNTPWPQVILRGFVSFLLLREQWLLRKVS